ncbi:N-acetylmuramoyl-L-alanine amidase [Micromonospora sp. WMMD812]|uniref:peptidoglycan recognition protein family protein n=1 Tax=Micromonospora sp. WMMD812 TaxID=3015152 RepID=UPI00248BDBC5|nr:N-acetylmuramoyl-L-alanine amidase [Micromonospora sp. WMMD812]WBB69083.1 N-acetylmuramoyl-L-alanine amidase [Micromonospora sp. WMMD812]
MLREFAGKPEALNCAPLGRLREQSHDLAAVVEAEIRARVDLSWFVGRCEKFVLRVIEDLLQSVEVGAPVTDNTRAEVRDAVERAAGAMEAPAPPPASHFDGQRIPLGVLASDHAGFVSFDLTRIHWAGLVADRMRSRCAVEVEVFPLLLEAMRFRVLDQHRIAPDAIVAKLELPMRDEDLIPAFALNLPAMQNPGIIDWRLSPGSFAAVPQSLVGADGCETFTPANFAVSEFHVRQVIRLSDGFTGVPEPSAYVNEYVVSIVPIGHSLGQVLYTLPLAPGESVRLAVIDWRRTDVGTRDEKTVVTESLIHDQARDRTITETVTAALEEWQRGGSVMGGLAGGAGASGQSGSTSVAGGGMLSVGGAYATSSGSKDVTAASVQKITDAIHQSSLAQRELTSSVVVQMDQAERQAIETRSFANHNRGHTLTVIYYEVLRHFRVVTEFTRRYRAALLPRRERNFDDENLILNKRFLLEPALLDKSLAGGFEALKRLDMRRKEYMRNPVSVAVPVNEADLVIKQVEMRFRVGGEESTNAVVMRIHFTNGNSTTLRVGGKDNLNSTELFDDANAPFQLLSDVISVYVTWGTVSHMEIEKTSGTTILHLNLIEVYALGDFGSRQLVKHTPGKHYEFEAAHDKHTLFTEKPPPAPPPVAIKTPEQEVSIEDYHGFIRLREHLKSEKTYYSRILDLGTHPDEYATEFETRQWGPTGKTIDAVAPAPLEIMGSKIAFPLTPQEEDEDEPITVPRVERLMSLPTRGVFAEAKLGHCNVAEEIDETRFWRWGEHALPFTAPEIAAIQAAQPQRADLDLKGTPLPTPVVNIQNAPALPDPTGLAAALKVLSTPEIFRDMSAREEVGALLEDLVNGSVSMAQAANRAREIQANSRAQGSGGGPAAGSVPSGQRGSGTTAGGGSWSPQAPSDLHQFGNVLKQGVNSGFIDNERASQIYRKSADDMSGASLQNTAFGAGSGALGQQLQQAELERRATLKPTDIAVFTPASEHTLVSYAREWTPPAGLNVVNWRTPTLDHYGSVYKGRRIGGRLDGGTTPHPYPTRRLPSAIVLHETVGWAAVGAGVQEAKPPTVPFDFGLSVHFSVGPDGTVYQHNDIAQILDHATKANVQSVGIEVTNASVVDKARPDPISLTPSLASAALHSLQTGEVVGGLITDDRERLAVSWVDGSSDNFLYVLPAQAQLEGVTQLVAWLASGTDGGAVATFLNAKEQSHWRQHLVRTAGTGASATVTHSFLLHGHPGWRDAGFGDFDGIFAHTNFDANKHDGGPIGLYAWLRLFCGKTPADAYTALRAILTDKTLVHEVEVGLGRRARAVNVSSMIPATVEI